MHNQKVFLEIGTCDFDTCLPLAEQGWKGYMVEADPKYAEKITSQTKQYDVEVSNQAITDYDGYIRFHTTLETTDSDTGWTRGIGHVASDNHIGSRLLDEEVNKRFIDQTITVPCSTLDTYIEETGIDRIDFMKIDVEGHEVNVLASYSWDVKPTFIKVEHSHIDDIRMCNLLRAQGYMVWTELNDIYGVL